MTPTTQRPQVVFCHKGPGATGRRLAPGLTTASPHWGHCRCPSNDWLHRGQNITMRPDLACRLGIGSTQLYYRSSDSQCGHFPPFFREKGENQPLATEPERPLSSAPMPPKIIPTAS